MRKAWAMAALILLVFHAAASAEKIRIGKTQCLLQPAAEEDRGKRYVLFVGSGDYFFATRNCADITAADGLLLIPQGDSAYQLCSAASDVVIRDLEPQILEWAREGHEIVLTGYSAGGYPATALAVSLAEAGYTGRLYLLDGVYNKYRGIAYNAAYFRENLATWQVTICASSSQAIAISERTRAVGEVLGGDGFAVYRRYAMTHNELKALYAPILSGAPWPEAVEENGPGSEEADGGD